ncbi:MAG: trypsin-like peptidase domain-containing protein [Hyphomicrobiaceae bacterium]|nr:trypsin-like peptidase domain-containing protein [Hyphomicrobiaceae bacterium]
MAKTPPQPEAPAETDAADLLARIEAAAYGDNPDRQDVAWLLHHLRGSDATLSADQYRRLFDIIFDLDMMAPHTSSRGPHPHDLMDTLKATLQGAALHELDVEDQVKALCDVLADVSFKLAPEQILATLKALRNRRLHEPITVLSDRLLTRSSDGELLGRIGAHYGRSLIETGKIIAGIEVLNATIEHGELSVEESVEAWGGVGRAHKQIYVNHQSPLRESSAREQTMGPHLARAIEAYSRHYDPKNPGENSWLGINLVALLKRAAADGVRTGSHHDADAMARGIIAAAEPCIATTKDIFLPATLAEAYLAVGQIDSAAKYYGMFAKQDAVDAFALNSAVRQLEEVWQLEAGTDGARALVCSLKGALSQKEGGHIRLTAGERRAIANASRIEYEEYFESRTTDGKTVPLAYLQRIVKKGSAVAAIKKKHNGAIGQLPGSGPTRATGFLINGPDFGLSSDRSYLLTNAHVIWAPETGQRLKHGLDNKALAPSQAEIVFEADDGRSGVYAPKKVVWQSTPSRHDTCIVALDRMVPSIEPLSISDDPCTLTPDDGNGTPGTPLAVIGHPSGHQLSIGLVGTLEEIQARLVDKGPKVNRGDPEYLHYTAPTEVGNSGSPVFETSNWEVVGVHHAGFNESEGRPRLGGKAGTNHANEGVCIHCIRAAVIEQRPK